MKIIIALVMLLATVSGYSQGAVKFNNFVATAGIDAPVSYSAWGCLVPNGRIDGARANPYMGRVWGGIYTRAALYGGPVGAAESALVQLGPAVGFRTGSILGYVSNSICVFSNIAPGTSAIVQMRVWDCGIPGINSYEEAVAESARTSMGMLGKSGIVEIASLGDTNSPSPMIGLTGFAIHLLTGSFRPIFYANLTSTNTLVLRWEGTNCSHHLQVQTNWLGTNWYDLIGAPNPMVVPLNNERVFYRIKVD